MEAAALGGSTETTAQGLRARVAAFGRHAVFQPLARSTFPALIAQKDRAPTQVVGG